MARPVHGVGTSVPRPRAAVSEIGAEVKPARDDAIEVLFRRHYAELIRLAHCLLGELPGTQRDQVQVDIGPILPNGESGLSGGRAPRVKVQLRPANPNDGRCRSHPGGSGISCRWSDVGCRTNRGEVRPPSGTGRRSVPCTV